MRDAAADRIVAEAAGWLVRLDQAADASTRSAWQAWHDADPRHADVWRRFGHLRQTVPDGSRAPDHAAVHAVRAVSAPPRRRQALKLLAGCGALGVAGSVGYRHGDRAGWFAAHRTGTGEQRTLALPDMASLMMNTGTALDLDVRGQAVDVRLHAGEIVVDTPASVALRVLTCHGEMSSGQARSAVRVQAGATRIALDRGAARIVTLAGHDERLQGGQVRRFDADRITAESGWAGREFAWTQGMLIADDMRLDDVLAELARYRPGVVRCDPAVAGLRVTGSFRVRETDRVLEALAAKHRLKVAYYSRYWVDVS